MAGIEDLKKQMSQVADDEYYAGLQSLFERDPLAKEMNVSDLTYPFMEKSGEYNYQGSYARDDNIEALKRLMKIRKFPISPESSFNEKLEKGEKPIMIYQEPVSTGSGDGELKKIAAIMHEFRHKAFDKPKYKKFMKDRNLNEETFVRFLDNKFFPEVDTPFLEHGKEFANPKKSMKKYNQAVDDFLLEFGEKEPGFINKLKKMFAEFAEGGIAELLGEPRSGYQDGGRGYQEYWTTVQESFINAGGQEGTGMNIHEFADIYFPRKAEGGRIGLAEGDTPSEAWMRDYFYSSGKDRLGVITLYEYMYGPEGYGWRDYMNYGPGKAEGGRIGAGDGYKPGDFLDFLNKEEPKILDPFEGVDLKLYKELLEQGIDADTAFKKAGGKAEGGRIGFQRAGSVPYLSRGWSQPGVYKAPRGYTGMEEILAGGILGTGAANLLKDKDKDKDKPVTKKTKKSKTPEITPPEDKGPGGLTGGLLRTGIMEAFEHLTRRYGDDLGEWAGNLGDIRKFFTQVAPDKVDEIVKSYGQNRKIDLSKKMKEFLNNKIKRYKSDLEDIKEHGQLNPIEEVGDYAEELKWLIRETKKDIKAVDQYGLLKQSQKATKHAEGGRIGFKEGEGIMSRVGDMVDIRNVPYYSGKALQGLVNSAETLSKFPFAAGKLGSQLIQKPGFKRVPREKSDDPMEELFLQQTGQDYRLEPTEVWGEALENITPGSWSENLGLTSLIEDMEKTRPEDAKTVGGILGLGTEIAVPTGGAFKAGQFLLNKASKAMGKVKDGKTLNKLVDEKLTDAGQSRRDFMSVVGTSGLMAGLKWLGLGSLLKGAPKVKPSDDVVMRLRTFIDDSDVDTEWGPVAQGQWAGAFDIESLSKAAQKTMEKLMMPVKEHKGIFPVKGTKEGADSFTDIPLEDGSYILEQLQKAGHKVKYEHIDDIGGSGVDEVLSSFKNDPIYKGTKEGAEHYKKFKEKTDKWSPRKKAEYHTSITDDWGEHINPDVEEFYDIYYGVEKPKRETIVDFLKYSKKGVPLKKAEGGRIGLGTGGLAGMLGERTGFPQGKRVTKKPKKPKKPKVMTIDEAIADINKKLEALDPSDDESIRLRIILHDLILGPGMGGPRGDKIYQSEEDLPEGILEMLQKDPAFDFEKFSEIEWSPKGLRWTDKGQPFEGTRGSVDPMRVWSGMAPFGETAYYDEGRGPRNRNIHMTDLDKAKIINHELRHNLMGDEGSPLYYTQPEWVKEYEGPHYLRSQDNKPIGTSGHELYNRFIDSRLFPGEEHRGPNAPYFDKILRDHWEPYFQKYKKAVKELKSKPEHLSAEGGRIGLGTGGPPITLQRPMFNDGGLTKTIPPERGPDPQGLPSALYNGIMRPRSY